MEMAQVFLNATPAVATKQGVKEYFGDEMRSHYSINPTA